MDQKPETWTLGRFALLLATLMTVSFPDPILFAKSFVFRDFGVFGYPLAVYHRQSIWGGELPLWNPYSCCGLPFLAQWNTMVFYPFSAIYLIFPLPWSVTFFCLIHLWWGGVGACHFIKQLTGSGLAGWCTGVAFVFNGLAMNCLMWPNNIAALAWVPWLIFAARQATSIGGRWVVAASGISAVQLLTGAPEIIVFNWVFVAGFVLAARTIPLRRIILRIGIVVVLATLLASIQLMPFLDFLMHSQRNPSFGDSTWSMPSWGLLNLVVPLFHNFKSTSGVFFQVYQGWTSSYYPGVIVLLLAITILGRRTAWLWSVAIFGLIMALGEKAFLYGAIQKILPFLGFMRFPIKFVILPVIALPFLAGFAIATWQSAEEKEKKKFNERLLIAAGVLVIIAVILGLHSNFRPYSFTTPREIHIKSAISRIIFIATFVLLIRRFAGETSAWISRLIAMGMVLLVWADGWTHTPDQNPCVEPSFMIADFRSQQFSKSPTLGVDRAFNRLTNNNIYAMITGDLLQDCTFRRMALMHNCNLLDRIPTLDGFYSLYLPDQRKVWDYIHRAPTNRHVNPMLDFLGVGQITSHVIGWEKRAGAMPIATVGQRAAFIPDRDILPFLFSTNFHPKEVAVFSDADKSRIKVHTNSFGRILHSTIKAQKLVFDVESAGPTLLVCSQTFYHAWKAEINGEPTRIFKANGAFQAVEVPAGRNQVVFIYRDRMFWAGCFLSSAGLAALAVLWLNRNRF